MVKSRMKKLSAGDKLVFVGAKKSSCEYLVKLIFKDELDREISITPEQDNDGYEYLQITNIEDDSLLQEIDIP